MIRIIILLGIVFMVLYIVLHKGNEFETVGKTIGVCVEIKTELMSDGSSPHNKQMRGRDNRVYRPYIKYEWEGKEYIAKSFRAYTQPKIFPGDRLFVWVSATDKMVVKID